MSCARVDRPSAAAGNTATARADPLAWQKDPAAVADNDLARRIVREATSVETFRVRPRWTSEESKRRSNPKYAAEFIGFYPIDRRGPVMKGDFTGRLAAVLLDESNYIRFEPGQTKKCIFEPGVAFRMRSGADRVDILLCFTCQQLSVNCSRGHLRLPAGDFDPGVARFAALAKEAFPKDPVVAALP